MPLKDKIPYGPDFFKNRTKASDSADVIVPLLLTFCQPESVIDVGCATGNWLRRFKEAGCLVKGMDGEYVLNDEVNLEIAGDEFEARDLNQRIFPAEAPGGEKKYGLAVSLEVAEHLEPERAESFVRDLTMFSDIVLFSAAIPYQPGVHHVNCQFQSYWEELFRRYGYQALDCLRPIIWDDGRVNVIYRNNMIVYYNTKSEDAAAKVQAFPSVRMPSLNMVHPELFRVILSCQISACSQLAAANAELMRTNEEMMRSLDLAVSKLEEIAGGKGIN